MTQHRLCLLGFGNVGRALARLFLTKTAELRDLYGIEWLITGIASRRLGWLVNPNGFDVAEFLGGNTNNNGIAQAGDFHEWLDSARPDAC